MPGPRRPQFVKLVNRTTKPLECMYDGIIEVIEPGYKTVEVLDDKGKPKTKKVKGHVLPVVQIVGTGEHDEPGFQMVEYFAAEKYIQQHPINGTMRGAAPRLTQYLLGCERFGLDIDHVEQSDAIELLDRSQLGDDQQTVRVLRLSGGRAAVPIAVIEEQRLRANKRAAAELRLGREEAATGFGNTFGMETRSGARW